MIVQQVKERMHKRLGILELETYSCLFHVNQYIIIVFFLYIQPQENAGNNKILTCKLVLACVLVYLVLFCWCRPDGNLIPSLFSRPLQGVRVQPGMRDPGKELGFSFGLAYKIICNGFLYRLPLASQVGHVSVLLTACF